MDISLQNLVPEAKFCEYEIVHYNFLGDLHGHKRICSMIDSYLRQL